MSASPSIAAPAPPRRERRKQARPGELVDAALALFVEKGFAATRVEEVAARAGVSKGTLFLYFPSKEALFKAVVHENAARHLDDAMREVADFTGSSAELLCEFIRRWWTQYGGTPAAGLTKLMMSEAANFPELARFYQDEVVQPGHRLLRLILQRGIERGEFRPLDLETAIDVIYAPLMMLVVWRSSMCFCAKATDPADYLKTHFDLLVQGLCQQKGLA